MGDKGEVTIAYADSQPSWSPSPPRRVELNDTDWFDVKGLSWPSELSITAIKFFEGTSPDPENEIGEWHAGDPANTLITKVVDGKTVNCFKVSGKTASDVKIEDAENTNKLNDDSYYYKVHVVRTGKHPGSWWLDPQVINKKSD